MAHHRVACQLVPCATLGAQAPQLQPGARLRLTVPCELGPECRVEGRFVQLRADTASLPGYPLGLAVAVAF